MKWIRNIMIVFVLGVCLIGTLKFIPMDSLKQTAKKEEVDTTTKQQETKTEDVNDNTAIWNKAASYYMEGAVCEETSSKVKHKDWIYKVHSAKITKKRDPKWDFVPDFDEYKYDKDENLINEYSYVAINLSIQYKKDPTLEHHVNFYLNSMWLGIFDEEGERVSGGEMRTAALGKEETQSYFFCDLKEGETLDTTVVFMIEDKFLSEDNYYILEVTGGSIKQSLEDFALIKLPLGVEKHETDSKK